jgi:hypothetical protein
MLMKSYPLRWTSPAMTTRLLRARLLRARLLRARLLRARLLRARLLRARLRRSESTALMSPGSGGMNFWMVVKTTTPPATRSFSRGSARSAAWTGSCELLYVDLRY